MEIPLASNFQDGADMKMISEVEPAATWTKIRIGKQLGGPILDVLSKLWTGKLQRLQLNICQLAAGQVNGLTPG